MTAQAQKATKAAPELIRTHRAGKVLTIELDNPPAHSLSSTVIAKLHATLDEARLDRGVNVIVLAASGKIFCAGHDLKEMKAHRTSDDDGGRLFLETLFHACSAMMKAVVRHPKPIIAKVDGIATAAGCQLVASCDLAIASDRSTFCTPGVNLGGFCSTPMVALSRNIGRKHAMEMLLTGEMIDAQAARDFGLVNRVVPADYLDQVVDKYAAAIASKSPVAIARGKQAFYEQADMRLSEAYDYANRVMVDGFMTHDSDEGLAAFFEKREAEWKGE
ncbi:enoyl-CoA hydratase [Zhengella mangrovi]|uniref:Enoyl-CoA hydratase domain-containing protein 3, mitochondrial n=1 Tax=Zhengella mangrovi TaxID=1982044 RepID=A0A2G1QN34_9HYPH|nr:enoyl-CoA hydratase [Zhengella mangrovi]PHP66933.1 enoyl-CoA hydratase [Zhengella mangrovi]